jgi:hypothetical protein
VQQLTPFPHCVPLVKLPERVELRWNSYLINAITALRAVIAKSRKEKL